MTIFRPRGRCRNLLGDGCLYMPSVFWPFAGYVGVVDLSTCVAGVTSKGLEATSGLVHDLYKQAQGAGAHTLDGLRDHLSEYGKRNSLALGFRCVVFPTPCNAGW